MGRILREVRKILTKKLIANPLLKVYVDDIREAVERLKLGTTYDKSTQTLRHSEKQLRLDCESGISETKNPN